MDEDRDLQTGDRQRSPSEIDHHRDLFDRFAAVGAYHVSGGVFFMVCGAALVAWTLGGFVSGFTDRYLAWGALGIGVVILLLVAILENAQRRSDQAVQRKLNAIADALADFMEDTHLEDRQVEELRAAVGLEHRESTRDARSRLGKYVRRP